MSSTNFIDVATPVQHFDLLHHNQRIQHDMNPLQLQSVSDDLHPVTSKRYKYHVRYSVFQ
jgi:uncharacterized protein YprB with RNaseH-like and TPR domain